MKTLFPPLVAFAVFAVIVLLQSFIYPIHIGDMGKGNLHAFMACFYYMWPLYLITAVLTQWVIVTSVWEAAPGWTNPGKDVAVIITCLVCALFAGSIAYAMWDKQTGIYNLAGMAILMLLIQLAYWVMNCFVMFILGGGKVKIKPLLKKETPA